MNWQSMFARVDQTQSVHKNTRLRGINEAFGFHDMLDEMSQSGSDPFYFGKKGQVPVLLVACDSQLAPELNPMYTLQVLIMILMRSILHKPCQAKIDISPHGETS